MDREDISTEQSGSKWFIDLSWFQQNNRSFIAITKDRLCAKCRDQLETKNKKISADDIVADIRDCCSKTPGFISDRLPILECIFRLFLANGNQPLNLEELSQQLSEWQHRDAYSTSAETLRRLLNSDRYYGLCQMPTP